MRRRIGAAGDGDGRRNGRTRCSSISCSPFAAWSSGDCTYFLLLSSSLLLEPLRTSTHVDVSSLFPVCRIANDDFILPASDKIFSPSVTPCLRESVCGRVFGTAGRRRQQPQPKKESFDFPAVCAGGTNGDSQEEGRQRGGGREKGGRKVCNGLACKGWYRNRPSHGVRELNQERLVIAAAVDTS